MVYTLVIFFKYFTVLIGKPDEMVQQRTTDPSEDISSTDNKTGIKEGT